MTTKRLLNVPVWHATIASDNRTGWYILTVANSVTCIFGKELGVAVSNADNEGDCRVVRSTVVLLLGANFTNG